MSHTSARVQDLQSLADIGAISEQYRAEAWKSLQRRCFEYLQAHESHRINVPALRPSSPALIDIHGSEDNHERFDRNEPSIQISEGPRPAAVSGKHRADFDLDAFERQAATEWGDISSNNRLANSTPRRTSQPATDVVGARPRARHAWSEGSVSDHPDTEDDDVGLAFPSPLSSATAVVQVAAKDNIAGQNGPKDKKVKKSKKKKPDRQSTERQEPNQLNLANVHEKEHLHLSTDKQLSDSLKPTEEAQRLFVERGSSEELVLFAGRQQQQVRQTQMHIQQPKSSPKGSPHTNTQPPAKPALEKSKKPTQIICPFWVTYGKGACALKAHCPFLHEAVRGLPQETLECWFLRTHGHCTRQASCRYAHHKTAHGVWAPRPPFKSRDHAR